MTGERQSLASHINKDPTPCSVFRLCFAGVITLLVEETNQYYQKYLDVLDSGPSPVPDVTESEMFPFLEIIVQLGHDIPDKLKDCWSTTEQFFSPFYCKTVRHDRFVHILRFLHFLNNDNLTEMIQTVAKYGK
jgi:hypothetical protein